ncbi:unnamed protein product [Rhodiola kirilowii]
MADCSRPPHRNQRGLTKNLSSVFGFGNKGPYDDVFVSRPKMRAPAAFTPGVKDYAEIFNCSQPSSIPVLELDEFDRREGFGDEIRSYEVDYGNVFGGLGEGKIGSSYEEVFGVGGDGVRQKNGSHTHLRGSDPSTAAEESQKLTSKSLREKKHSMSSNKFTRGGKGETEETNGQAKRSEVPVSTHAFDGIVPLKKASVSIAGATTNDFKQYSEEAPVGRHSRKVSSGELSKHAADGFIVFDVGSRNGDGSDKSISSDAQMETNIIRSKVPISEATTASNAIPQLGSPVSTSKEQAGLKHGMYRSNASEEGAKVQNVHGPEKPFIRDFVLDESVATHNASSSKVVSSSGLTHDHSGGCATLEVLTGNSDARNSNAGENAKDDNYSYSQQDVKFQTVNGLREPFISNSLVDDASNVRPQESSKSFGKLNTSSGSDSVPKSTYRGSNEPPTNTVKSKEAGHVGPAMKKTTTSKFSESKSTYSSVKDNHSPSSSDDEIDKNSEAAVSAAALKKALREAQAWINIAKESNGVKGFMNHVMAKKSGLGKVVMEVHKSNIKENPKFFELEETVNENSCSASAARRDYTAPWSTISPTNMAPADSVDKEVNLRGSEFGASDKLNQMKDVESSLRKEIEVVPTIQHATPSVNTSKEKLAVCSSKVDKKLVHRTVDTTMQSMDVDSGQARDSEVPASSAGHEALLNNFYESNTVLKITEAERKTQETMKNSYHGFMIRSFDDAFGQFKVGRSANNFESKEDVVSATGTGHTVVHTNHHGAMKGESEGLCIPCSDNSEEVLISPEEENVTESQLNRHDQVSGCEDTDSQAIRGESEGLCIPCSDNSEEVLSLEEENVTESNLDPQYHVSDCEDSDSQAIKGENEGLFIPCSDNPEEALISMEEENVTESKMDTHDQVSDCEDTESLDYVSAKDYLGSSDSDEEISKYEDPNYSAQNQLDEIEDVENMVVSTVTIVTEDGFGLCFNNLNESPVVEETDESEDILFQNIVIHDAEVMTEERTAPIFNYSNEDPIVEETDQSEGVLLQNMVAHEAKATSEEGTAPIFNYSNEDPIVEEFDESEDTSMQNMVTREDKFTSEERTVPYFNNSDENLIAEETHVTGDVPILNIVSPEVKITLEDGVAPCLNSTHEDPRVETHGREGMTEQNMVIPEPIIIFKDDLAPCVDNSNDNMMVEEIAVDTTCESRVSSPDPDHEKAAMGEAKFCIHEQTTLDIEELESVAGVQAESGSRVYHGSSPSESSDVELISTGVLTEDYSTDSSRSTPWTCEHEKQEVGAATFCNLEARTESEELHDVDGVEAAVIGEGHETMNVKSFENDQVTVDAAGQEDAIELQSTPLYSEDVNLEMEAEIQFSEPVSDTGINEDSTEFEPSSENLIQPVERHERKKWEIPKEIFELPELKTGVSDIQNTLEPDGFEVERQMDKHERKKWEIPKETFELPVLGDEVVEDNEENVEQDIDRVAQSGEKPERKKWKIQKEVFVVPILCSEAVQENLEHEEFVTKSASEEEMGMGVNLTDHCKFSEEIIQRDEVQNKPFANEVVVSDKGASSGLSGDNSKEDMARERMREIKFVDEVEDEHEEQSNENSSQQETTVDEEKAVGREECTKGLEDINVKDEIKRTLGMLWKKLYNSKQDEDIEPVELVANEEVTPKDTLGQGVEKDLNLMGPVELVESPRQHNDIQAMNFAGLRSENKETREEASYSEPFEVNGSSTCNGGELPSTPVITEEVQNSSTLPFCSCRHQEDDKGCSGKETCELNYNPNDVESQSEEILSSSGSDGWTEMAPIYGAGELKKEISLDRNILPSDVNECCQVGSETVSGLEPLVDDAKNTQMLKKVLQQNGSKNTHDDTTDENTSEDELETHALDDLSDKSCADSEQQDTSYSREDSKSVPDIEVPDVTLSLKIEQKEDQVETGPDKIEQACSWKWIFGEDLKGKSNEQDETPEVGLLRKEKAMTKEVADEINMSQVTGKAKINYDKPLRMEERAPEGMQKKVIPDQEVLKNLMKIERIAVERAIREARERAFADARERAAKERANAEARQRIALERGNAESRERGATESAHSDAHQKVSANGQERSQKTSSETKLAAEKNSLEAKRKAELERAAVERATVEARQRALEKAMSRKDQVSQSNSSRLAGGSSDQYGSSSKDRLDDDKPSESALRFKARNERHQRIAERAAKALEEKNMRDLLVQREQAERNKLAEVLDADVKRWSRGKTGNLRALLSTLQYILGPDSGWQPIHLTDIVTADAVKKAYRKATLFVHPDKLQQRGATIKQKYICEKVFDLLKDAWNRFDRDER